MRNKINRFFLSFILFIIINIFVINVFGIRKVLAACWGEDFWDLCVSDYECICGPDYYNPDQYSCLRDLPREGSCPPGQIPVRSLLSTCDSCDSCDCGSGCFRADTKISTPGGEKNIQDLKPGDEVKSFDVKTNKETKSIVQKIYETTRSAYYKITLKDGTVLKATGEHPLWAIKANNKSLSFFQYLKTESLAKKIIDWLRERL